MRNYYPQYSELPPNVYRQVELILEDYSRLQAMRSELLLTAPQKAEREDGESGNPTAQWAIKIAYVECRLRAIEQAQAIVKETLICMVEEDFSPIKGFFHYGYFNAKHLRTPKNENGPSSRTWRRYRYCFASLVAKKLNYF